MAKTVKTLGQLKKSGYEILPIREELRKNLIAKIKSGGGPFLIECKTYRTLGHAGPNPDDQIGYRTKEEIDSWIAKCPIKTLETYMKENNIMDAEQQENLTKELIEEIKEAVKYAEDSPFPDDEDMLSDVMSTRRIVI